jgi:hypothetical protein
MSAEGAGLVPGDQPDRIRWNAKWTAGSAPSFRAAAGAVADGGLLAWEALTADARENHPGLPPEWCLKPGEPASLLPPGFRVLDQSEVPVRNRRRMLARRDRVPKGAENGA